MYRRLIILDVFLQLSRGIRTRIRRKYRIDATWPIMMKGCLTGCPLIHISVRRSATSSQNKR